MKKFMFLLLAFLAFAYIAKSQGLENFNNSNATSSYSDGNFVGENGITWYYVQSRDANGDANNSGISLPALMLRRSSSNSKVYCESISGGIGNFSVKLYKGFTGTGNRQVELFINDVSYGTSTPFDDYAEHIFSVNNINVSGNIVIRIDDITSKQVIVDDITWTGYSSGAPDNPTDFTAITASTSQIDLSWTQNTNNDDVMVAWSSDGTFGTPVDGTTYTAGNSITGGGTVIYNGSATSFNHTGLTADTRYYYKAWSHDATPDYSSGVTDDTTTLATEPTADPTVFSASTISASEIDLSWTDANPAADNYLIKGSSVGYGDITNPIDGTSEADGGLVLNLASGVGAAQFTGLAPNTTYYFQIYPYNGNNGSVNYKTDNPQQASSATQNTNTDLIISEVADPKDVYKARFIELYNPSTSTIDFDVEDWYLCRQTNGGTTWENKKLTGSITAGGTYVAANYNGSITDFFYTSYGFMADYDYGGTAGNGDDGYFLYYGGDHTSGTLIDAYGVIDQDGTNYPWKYEDTKAVRLRSVTSPNTTWTASEWNILPKDQNTTDMTPEAYRDDVTWQGTTSTDWNAKGNNWSGTWGYIPDASFNVTIPNVTNAPVISAQSACNNLTLNSGSSLDLSVNIGLTAYGDLDATSGTFTVKSGTGGNGSFIGKGMLFGNVTVERYIAAYSAGDNGWHEISSPIDMMTISGSDLEPGTSDDLYEWIEQTAKWHNYKPAGSSFTLFYGGQGYLVAYATTTTKHFTGELSNSDFDESNLPYTTGKGNGWNFLGNPYTSAIEWNTADWVRTNIGAVAEIWDESAGTYALINTGGIIPSTNGFFVEVANGFGGNNSLSIPASARVHNTTGNYKNSRADEMDETLVLKITNDENGYYDINRIGFKPDATEGWDIEFDAHKLFGSSTAPQLWTISNGEKFAQNYLPYVYEPYEVPLHFRAGVNTTYHILAQNLESFYDNSDIFLEDLKTGKIINLNDQQLYTFTATTDDDEARFVLHFNDITSVGETPETQNASVYTYDNRVYIRFNEVPKSGYEVEVFNTLGQQVYAGQMEPNTLNSFRLDEKTGIYIVRVKTNEGLTVQKVMIN